MDFSKPAKAPGTRAYPPAIDLPGVEDETGAGSEFLVWKNILPESPGKANTVSNPMSVLGPGSGVLMSLAAQLHWAVTGETAHQQVEIKIGESVVSVDREWADHQIFELFDAALIACCTSCVGSQRTWGYIMFSSAESAQRFLQVWHRYLTPLGYRMPALDFTARSSKWRAELNEEFRFPRVVPVDEEGLTFTARWREHRDDMIEILPKLAWALRCHLRRSAEKKRLNLQG